MRTADQIAVENANLRQHLEALIGHLRERDWFKDGYNGCGGYISCSMNAKKVREAIAFLDRNKLPARG